MALKFLSSGDIDGEFKIEVAGPKLQLKPTTQNNASIIELGVLNGGTNAYARIDAINLQNYDTNLRFWTNAAGSTTQVERMRIATNLITFPTITELRGDIASSKFAVGNMGDASSQMMVSSRGFLTLNVSNTGSGLDALERLRITATGAISLGSTGTNYGSSGQVLTSGGNSNPTWTTPTTGTVTGSGANKQVTYWTSSSNIDGNNSLKHELDSDDNALLDISSDGSQQIRFFDTDSSYTESMRLLRFDDKLIITYGDNANEEALTVVGTGSSVGNVGIGLITPGAKLDVLQEARVSYANSNQYTLRITNTDGNPRILADGSAAHLIFGTTPSGSATATERVRIQNDGNVGIGTASPSQARLCIDGTQNSIYLTRGGASDTKWTISSDSVSMYFQEAVGSYVLTLKENQHVGIGTTQPATKLHLGGTAPGDSIIRQDSTTSGTNWEIGERVAGKWQIFEDDGNTIVTTFMSTGNVGIGTESPDSLLQLESSANPDVELKISNTATVASGQNFGGSKVRLIADGTNGDGHGALRHALVSETDSYDNWQIRSGNVLNTLAFDTGGTERMQIKSNGQIDFASPGTPNQSGISMFGGSNGGIMYMYRPVGQNGDIIRFQTAISSTSSTRVGYINTTGSATTYNSASDYRLKENVVKITGALDRVSKLKPSRFNFIIEPENTVDGFIAHEVQEVVPEAVTGYKDEVDENGENHYQGMDNSRLVPLLAAAIQEQQKQIDRLEEQIKKMCS